MPELPTIDYEYDQAGNLTAVESNEVPEATPIDESYAYDGTGLRVSQTVSGTTRDLAWDRSGGLPMLLDDGERSYIYGPHGVPIAHISASGVPTYYHHDQLGSTRMLTTSAGSPAGKFTYSAYGSLVGASGTLTTPMGFAGQYTNAQSGLQYLRARVYDPATGQFLTVDPLREITRSPYVYVDGNPKNRTDPSGLIWAEIFDTGLDLIESCGDAAYTTAGDAFKLGEKWGPARLEQAEQCGTYLAGGDGSVGDCDPFELLYGPPEKAW